MSGEHGIIHCLALKPSKREAGIGGGFSLTNSQNVFIAQENSGQVKEVSMNSRICIVAGAAVVLLSGCSGNDMIIKKQAEMEARIEQLVQSYAATNAKLAEISANVADLQGQMLKTTTDLEEVKPGIKELQSSLEVVQKLQSEPKPASAKVEVINNHEPAPVDRETTAQDSYMKAFGLYSADKFVEAIAAFENFIGAFPESEYAANARYWIGECYYSQKNFKAALVEFGRVLKEYPQGKKVPDAMLKLGLTQISLKDQQAGKETFKALVEKYPKAEAAAKAREWLGKL